MASIKLMKNKMQILLSGATFLTLISCAHHRDVRPSDDGVHKVILNVEDKEEGYRNAMSQATDYCEELKLRPVVVNEGTKYQGSMDEQSYNRGKTASKVAQAVGGAVWAMGGQNESNAGGIVGVGGSVARGALGNGYQYVLNFRCK